MATTTVRRPAGTGWVATMRATSSSSSVVSTRMTPVWVIRASSMSSGHSSLRTWTGVRPLFTATIGFTRETRRAMRLNLRGLPKDWR